LRAARFNPRMRKEAENFARSFNEQTAIISPPVLVIISDKVAHGSPILRLDLRQKVRGVQSDLPLGSP
jgi:hypothetical protein